MSDQDAKSNFLHSAEHDRRRGTDFLATFPEMRQWWHECEALSKR